MSSVHINFSVRRTALYVIAVGLFGVAAFLGTNPKASFRELWKVDWTALGALATFCAAIVALFVGLAPLRAQRAKELRFLRMLLPAFQSEFSLAATRVDQAYQYFADAKEAGRAVTKSEVERQMSNLELPLAARWCEQFAALPGNLGALLVNAVGVTVQTSFFRASYDYDFPTFTAPDFETLMLSFYPNLAVCINALNAELRRIGTDAPIRDDVSVQLVRRKRIPIHVSVKEP